MRKIILLLLTLQFCFVSKINSQVTIGSLIEPERGALLEIKNKKAVTPASVTDDANVTVDVAGGGIRLPRVYLNDRKTLEPFIPENDSEWSSNRDNIKERHAGLMVYNTKVSSSSEINPDKVFEQGVYIWNGSRWKKAVSGKEAFFNMPAFSLPLTLGSNPDFDLYEVYKNQYPAVSGRLYAREELDFVVTYYNTEVLQINNLNAGGVAGKMAYSVVGMPVETPVPIVLINVVLAVKQ